MGELDMSILGQEQHAPNDLLMGAANGSEAIENDVGGDEETYDDSMVDITNSSRSMNATGGDLSEGPTRDTAAERGNSTGPAGDDGVSAVVSQDPSKKNPIPVDKEDSDGNAPAVTNKRKNTDGEDGVGRGVTSPQGPDCKKRKLNADGSKNVTVPTAKDIAVQMDCDDD